MGLQCRAAVLSALETCALRDCTLHLLFHYWPLEMRRIHRPMPALQLVRHRASRMPAAQRTAPHTALTRKRARPSPMRATLLYCYTGPRRTYNLNQTTELVWGVSCEVVARYAAFWTRFTVVLPMERSAPPGEDPEQKDPQEARRRPPGWSSPEAMNALGQEAFGIADAARADAGRKNNNSPFPAGGEKRFK